MNLTEIVLCQACTPLNAQQQRQHTQAENVNNRAALGSSSTPPPPPWPPPRQELHQYNDYARWRYDHSLLVAVSKSRESNYCAFFVVIIQNSGKEERKKKRSLRSNRCSSSCLLLLLPLP
ncbi:unnamed protein product [Victoria cruziana]